jgi:hypothetical protein
VFAKNNIFSDLIDVDLTSDDGTEDGNTDDPLKYAKRAMRDLKAFQML